MLFASISRKHENEFSHTATFHNFILCDVLVCVLLQDLFPYKNKQTNRSTCYTVPHPASFSPSHANRLYLGSCQALPRAGSCHGARSCQLFRKEKFFRPCLKFQRPLLGSKEDITEGRRPPRSKSLEEESASKPQNLSQQ